MKNQVQNKKLLLTGILMLVILGNAAFGQRTEMGQVAIKASGLASRNVFTKSFEPFKLSANTASWQIVDVVANAVVLERTEQVNNILSEKPEFIKVKLPVDNNAGQIILLLYKADISPGGLNVLTSDGKDQPALTRIVNYRGIIEGEPYSLVAFTFSDNEIMALISGAMGNLVLGKQDVKENPQYIIYNDTDFKTPFNFNCAADMNIPVEDQNKEIPESTLTIKCVNWYYEVDSDLYVSKGSVVNVNSYIQGIFNQVSTLYANDGISVTLGTIYVWTTTDPYTGPTTSDYLNQFGAYRTSFNGDLANLIGTKGSGGVAYVNGLCNSLAKYKMAYSGIHTSYSTVPAYSWTVEVITHEQGHQLGSRHTHDCAWNGNNTPIDGCGPAAGYTSGTCATGPLPVKGTIMSYCHLLQSTGIDFNLGFGPQPTSLIISKINSASCLQTCGGGCAVPVQPGAISGNGIVCQGSTEIYSVAAVASATSYTWILPSGWSGSSTGNSISLTTGSTGGTITTIANNSCGSSVASSKIIAVDVLPTMPGTIAIKSGSAKVCPGDVRTYTTPASTGGTFSWTVPTGTVITSGQGTNSIIVTFNSGFTANGIVSVVKSNTCGMSAARTLSILRNIPATPGAITGTGAGLCGLTNLIYSVPAVSGMTYNWTVPLGVTIANGQGTNILTVSFPATILSGDIAVTAVNTCGTSAIRKMTVKTTLSAPGVISGNATACPNTTGNVYSIVPVSYATGYIWTGPSGSHITANGITSAGNTLTTTAVSVTVSFAGITNSSKLNVRATNACGTSSNRSLTIIKGSCRSNFSENNSFTLYPNPASDHVTLRFESPSSESGTVNIVDMTGRTVNSSKKDFNEGSNAFEIKVEDYSPGIYIVTLTTSEGILSRKLEVR